MPRKFKALRSLLPVDEQGICIRLRQARMEQRYTQEAIANAVGVPRDRLASYEHGRAAVPFEVGVKVCRFLNLNQRWLRFGVEPQQPYVRTADLGNANHPDRTYSLGYDNTLSLKVEDWLKLRKQGFTGDQPIEELRVAALAMVDRVPLLNPSWEELRPWFTVLEGVHQTIVRSLPTALGAQYVRAVIEASVGIDKLLQDMRTKGNGLRDELTDISEVIIQALQMPMPPQNLQELIHRLTGLCESAGQAAIARELEVHPSRLNDWIKGRRQPGGEAVFKILSSLRKHSH